MPVENDPSPELADYAHPEKLVTADWVAAHLDDPNVVIVESDEGFRQKAYPARPIARSASRTRPSGWWATVLSAPC